MICIDVKKITNTKSIKENSSYTFGHRAYYKNIMMTGLELYRILELE